VLIVLIFEFQKSILITESALRKGPLIYPKEGQKNGHNRHYITLQLM